jgi:hypothetical protein
MQRLSTWPLVRRRVHVVVASALLLVAAAACGVNTATDRPDGSQRASPTATRSPPTVILNPSTVDDLLASIANAGLAVPNPRDVTARDCPDIGCTTKVETDTVSIIRFPSPGQAQVYAGSRHQVFQIADVVMIFSPSVPPSRQVEYQRVVKRAIE